MKICMLHAHVKKDHSFDLLWQYMHENSKLTLLYQEKEFGPFPQKGTRDSSSRVTSIVKDIYSDIQFWNANSALG